MSIKKQILSILSLLTINVVSAQSADTLRHVGMDEVQVAGQRRVVVDVTPAQNLAGEELQRLSVHSVADAVRYFSGVQIKDYGGVGGLKTVNVRSLGSQHVGVFYDGVELGNAQNGVVDLGRFSLDNMEAISIYNGQRSAIFQSAKDYASASAIYMTSRRPTFEEGKDYNLNMGIKAGSFKTVNPSALWEQKITNKVRASLSGEGLYTSGEYKFTYSKEDGYDTTQVRKNGDVRYLRGELSLFGDIDNGEWQAKAYAYSSERGYPGAVVRGAVQSSDRQWDNNIFVQGSVRKSLGQVYRIKANAKYANDYLHYVSDSYDNTYRQQEVYGSVVNMFDVATWASLAVASDFQYNTLDADLSGFVYPKRYQSLTSVAGSVDYKRFRAQASLLYTYVHDVTQVESANAGDLNRFTPTFIASYRPIKAIDLNLRALYKQVFRLPTLNDLYYTETGNSPLSPESTTQYNVGATYSLHPRTGALKQFEIQADLYYNEVEDKIIATPTNNQFRWSMANIGYVEIRGVDIVSDTAFEFGEVALSTRLSYTYQRAQDFTDPTSDYYGGQIPYAPYHSGSVILGVDYRGWGLNYSFVYTGERYESEANIAENYALPWYTSDVSVGKQFSIKGVALIATAELNNIFNQQYEVVQNYPMPGINYAIKLNVVI